MINHYFNMILKGWFLSIYNTYHASKSSKPLINKINLFCNLKTINFKCSLIKNKILLNKMKLFNMSLVIIAN
jgi:hypothetical protein